MLRKKLNGKVIDLVHLSNSESVGDIEMVEKTHAQFSFVCKSITGSLIAIKEEDIRNLIGNHQKELTQTKKQFRQS